MKILNFVLIMLFSNSFFAQDYNTKWKLVQDLESKQKIKSAIKEVDAIFLMENEVEYSDNSDIIIYRYNF